MISAVEARQSLKPSGANSGAIQEPREARGPEDDHCAHALYVLQREAAHLWNDHPGVLPQAWGAGDDGAVCDRHPGGSALGPAVQKHHLQGRTGRSSGAACPLQRQPGPYTRCPPAGTGRKRAGRSAAGRTARSPPPRRPRQSAGNGARSSPLPVPAEIPGRRSEGWRETSR